MTIEELEAEYRRLEDLAAEERLDLMVAKDKMQLEIKAVRDRYNRRYDVYWEAKMRADKARMAWNKARMAWNKARREAGQ